MTLYPKGGDGKLWKGKGSYKAIWVMRQLLCDNGTWDLVEGRKERTREGGED